MKRNTATEGPQPRRKNQAEAPSPVPPEATQPAVPGPEAGPLSSYVEEKKSFFVAESQALQQLEQEITRMQQNLVARRGAQERLHQIIRELEAIGDGKEELQAAAAGESAPGAAAAAAQRDAE